MADIEIRYQKSASGQTEVLDEVFASAPGLDFHLEVMAGRHVWFAFYLLNEDGSIREERHFDITTHKESIRINNREDNR